MEKKISNDLIRGHTDTIVLNILQQHDSYGYEIYKKILELSNGQYELKEATLYTAFRRLEKDGYIASYWGDETQGGRRKYYQITDTGRERFAQNQRDWEFAKEILNKLIKGGNDSNETSE
ncbi:PadR family transcriptional regulator [Halobacillus sp. Marseille-P3879]|uniref:PadR family transcriptional regulator n=1 Tax=Halobacillus sp. Marseille-P3879 TaxID=2045014 RepID=UPI000C7CD394|nr:PadR family transcriptional regulator [Halobacillus sp. Marseille-P3879]